MHDFLYTTIKYKSFLEIKFVLLVVHDGATFHHSSSSVKTSVWELVTALTASAASTLGNILYCFCSSKQQCDTRTLEHLPGVLGIVLHTFNPSACEAEVGRSLWVPARSTWWVPGQLELYSESLSWQKPPAKAFTRSEVFEWWSGKHQAFLSYGLSFWCLRKSWDTAVEMWLTCCVNIGIFIKHENVPHLAKGLLIPLETPIFTADLLPTHACSLVFHPTEDRCCPQTSFMPLLPPLT